MPPSNGQEALLQWVQNQTSTSVNDFGPSWKDGKVLCTLVASLWPKSLNLNILPPTPGQKLERALRVAVEHGVPRLVEPSEFASGEAEASLILLITQLYQIFKSNRPPSARLSKQQQRQSQFISHIEYCIKCNNPLSHINVECNGKHYHTECFACALCETKLTTSCIIVGGNHFCVPCGKKSFKVATWKVHRKNKPRWWLDLWRTSVQHDKIRFPGLTKEATSSYHSEEHTEDTDIDDDLFYSDDETEDNPPSPVSSPSRQRAPTPSPPQTPTSPPPPSIDYNDVLLNQIEDEEEKRAFVELFARLPEPEPVAVQLQLTAAPVSSSSLTGQPIRKLQHSTSPSRDEPEKPRSPKSRAHRSAMFIPVGSIPKDSSSSTSSPSRLSTVHMPSPSPAAALSPLSTRSVALPVNSHDQNDSDESPSSSPLSSPRGSSPRDSSRDSVYSNFSVSELSEASAPSPSNTRPPGAPIYGTISMDRNDRFSRMFAASVSKLLSSQDSMHEVEDPPIREGFLVKKMDLGVVRPWQRRYFLLRRDQLLYFVNKESRQKGLTLGIIPLNSVSQINPIAPAKARFQLVGDSGMNWYLQAGSQPEMHSWIQVLRKACHVRNEAKLKDLSATAGLSLNSLQKKEGSVEVRHKTSWTTRWIVLKDGILWEYAAKDGPLKAKIALYKSQLNEYQSTTGIIGQLIDWNNQSPHGNSYSFQVTSPTRNVIIRTNSAEQMHGWLNAILKQKVIVEEIIETVALESE